MLKASSQKRILTLADGRAVEAQAPVIVSASRSTDIPAFYADWFFKRLEEGYSVWKNPFNGKGMHVSYADTRFIVFWSKNPRPLVRHLDWLKDRGIACYIQFSVNDYEAEGYEPRVPPLEERLDTFRLLAEKLGPDGIIWRNDPLLLTDRIGPEELLRRAERIGDALRGYTDKLVFSFADMTPAVIANLRRAGVNWRGWSLEDMRTYAGMLAGLNAGWGYELATCAEALDLSDYGIAHNHCVDERLIIRRGWRDARLMEHLGARIISQRGLLCPISIPAGAIRLDRDTYAVPAAVRHDPGQRSGCGCIKSKDIGEYSTCRHFCVYCYANAGSRTVLRKCAEHSVSPDATSISGTIAAY